MKKRKHIWGLKIFLGALAFSLLIDLSGAYIFYQTVLSFIEDQAEIINADAGIIFFGDYNEDNSQIGNDSKRRANLAIELYRNEKIKHIIAIGGNNYKTRKSDHHAMKAYLIANGIPEEVIYYDSLSYNTITNWQESQKIMAQNSFESVVAISAPMHIYRIANMIDDQSVSFMAYQYKLESFGDYYELYRAVHHEWKSYILSFLFKEKLRNKISFVVRNTVSNIKDIFKSK
jgi:uncharacterized SAM-binding protein YcdF (DUF218 family)